MGRPKKRINKKQLKSIALMFLVISVMYSVSFINQEGIEPFIKEIHTSTSNLANFFLKPSITGFATILDETNNSPPYFDPSPPDYNLTEDQIFWVQLNATDPDNDSITFTDDSDSLEVNWQVFEMNGSGYINFTPRNEDVGNHRVGISIQDNIYPDPITENIWFSVTNTNDPPEIMNYTPMDLNPETTENDSIGFSFEYNATDPDIPYGDILTARWIVDGDIKSETNATAGLWSFTTGFCEPHYRNITLEVSDKENLTDSITWNLSIINVNREPIWNETIGNITWDEDINLTNNISLDNYFYDPDYSECGDNPSFSKIGNTNVTNVTINISSSMPHYVSFYPNLNWFGIEEIFFTIDDGYNISNSNNLTLNVTNVQDPPEIKPIPDQQAYAYSIFTYQVNASDPDGDTLTFSDNTPLFDIDPLTGFINFTPTFEDIGNYSIKITVSDGIDSVFTLMNLSILNNTAPEIDTINDTVGMENIPFDLTVTGFDADSDNLTFTSNYSEMLTSTQINKTAAKFSFTPVDDNTGNHTILVTVTDEKGATDSTTFMLEIVDKNNPPVLDPIGDKVAKINKTFSLNVNASDLDSGDTLAFSDNTTLFDINPSTGLIEFIPDISQEGDYTINISVTDDAAIPGIDWEIVVFTITENRPPVIDPIENQSATEDLEFNLTINATDPDGDTLTFSDNTPLFDIDPLTGFINFTPNVTQIGLHNIEITVDDGDNGTASATFWLNISEINDPPYFDPPLENQTAIENTQFYYDINATDEENDTLAYYDNSTLFNISSTGLINFTPTTENIGNHSINISVSDNNNITSSVIIITVLNKNDPPYITVYAPLNLTLNTAENSSLQFSVTADDDDLIYGDILTYAWYLDSVNQSASQSWFYEPDFTAAGQHNITIIVSDTYNETDRITWNISVNNTNRLPTFGIKVQTTEEDFNAGITNNTNTTTQSGSIILNKQGIINYYSSGTFISSAIDFSVNNNMNITYINWTPIIPAGTNITMRTRTSATEAGLNNTNWSSIYTNDSMITSEDYQFIQYRANLSTTNTFVTPALHDVSINYIISNFTGNQNTNYINWIDLDNYFYDADLDDNLTYNVTGNSNVGISIGNITNQVTLIPKKDWYGFEKIFFTMNDSYNTTRSNEITLTFEEFEGITPGPTIIVSGGGSTTIVKTKKEEVEKPYSFNLITPSAMTMYQNDTIIAPITLNNYGDTDLKEVSLTALVNNSVIKLKFTKDYFGIIEKKSSVKTNLVIESYTALGEYEVVVSASIRDPEFNDSAKFFMSSIELGQLSQEEFDTKITFTRDLLEENPECLELNEQLVLVQNLISQSDYKKAQLLLQSVVDTCKYLITTKEPIIEEPTHEKTESEKTRYIAVIAGIIFIIILFLYLMSHKAGSKRKHKK